MYIGVICAIAEAIGHINSNDEFARVTLEMIDPSLFIPFIGSFDFQFVADFPRRPMPINSFLFIPARLPKPINRKHLFSFSI